MKLKLEPNKFDQLQLILVDEIIQSIGIKLRQAGMEGEQLKELTTSIAFSITSAIDDTAAIESDGVEVNPYLTFRADDDERIHCGENSFLHEHVFASVKKYFDE